MTSTFSERIPIDLQDQLVGVEAVIDKDHTASLLARSVKADLFVILTEVDIVYYNFGSSQPEPLPKITVEQAQRYLQDGQFPPGSMGPKIEAVIDFLESGREDAVITSPHRLNAAFSGETGTRIVADEGRVS